MKTLFLTIALLAFTVSANAVTIQTTNPILDATFLDVGDSHWDTNTNLEWLDFADLVEGPMTLGYSINEAVGTYGSQGWRLPTFNEMYTLFDTFFEPDFVDSGNGTMGFAHDTETTLTQSRNSWMLDFGTDAVSTIGSNDPNDAVLSSRGMYLDELGNVQIMGVKLDTTNMYTTIYGPDFNLTGWSRDTAYTDMGVFMVSAHAVPAPAAIWLLGSGLIALAVFTRRRNNI